MQVEAMAELAAAAGPSDPRQIPCGLAHLKRSTAASKAWMPNARPECRSTIRHAVDRAPLQCTRRTRFH
jgi:hypothetical protein